MDTLVSVIIPYYNRPLLLCRALESVRNQSHTCLEVIVIDDGSAEPAEPLLGKFDDVRIVSVSLPENRGAAAARNEGIRRASGTVIAFLDSDDVWYPTKLEVQLGALTKSGVARGVNLCRINAVGVDRSTLLPRRAPGGVVDMERYLLCEDGSAQTSSIVLDAALAKEVLFDEGLPRHQDFDFLLRLSRAGAHFSFIDLPLVDWMSDASDRISRGKAMTSLPFLCKWEPLLSDLQLTCFKVKAAPLYCREKYGLAERWRLLATAMIGGRLPTRALIRYIVLSGVPRWARLSGRRGSLEPTEALREDYTGARRNRS